LLRYTEHLVLSNRYPRCFHHFFQATAQISVLDVSFYFQDRKNRRRYEQFATIHTLLENRSPRCHTQFHCYRTDLSLNSLIHGRKKFQLPGRGEEKEMCIIRYDTHSCRTDHQDVILSFNATAQISPYTVLSTGEKNFNCLDEK
jgi:hypothetical protein